MYLWFTPQGWVQRTLPGEIPRYQKKKKKQRERDNIVFPDVNLTIVTLFEPGPLQQLRNMLAKSCIIA